MTTRSSTSRAFRALRTRRASLVAVAASVVTVLALIQVPLCGMAVEACVLPSQGASTSHDDGAPTGAACSLAGSDAAMECCADEAHGQSPVQPEGTDTQAQKQLQPPALRDGCIGECIPCGPEGAPLQTESRDGAVPQVPLYTLFSSYLN